MKKYKAKANANIALIKYWGKENEELIIPNTSSLSLSLKALYTETKVSFIDSDKDKFYLNDQEQAEDELEKISKYIDLFRDLAKNNKRVLVESYNHVPTAAGLASSASAYAALATALDALFETNLSKKDLSIMARRGSGSASRSIYGGIVEWEKGQDHESSFAKKIDNPGLDMAMIIVLVNKNKKSISSRQAMKTTMATSPLYESYINHSKEDLEAIKEAIKNKDFNKVGEITEHNAMQMHATIISSNPPIIYFEEDSIKAINKVRELRSKGIPAYFTMDAGPNVKILIQKSDADKIMEELLKDYKESDLIYSDIASEDASVEVLEC